MFSFILQIQEFFEKFKKRKGLFFSTLTVLSMLGIILSLYYLTTVSNRALKSVYGDSRAHFLSSVEGKLISKGEQLLSNTALITSSPYFLQALNENNETLLQDIIKSNTASVNSFSVSKYEILLYSKDIIPIAGFDKETLDLNRSLQRESLIFAVSKLQPVIGMERIKDIVYERAIVPIVNGQKELLGIIEARQELDFLYQQLHDEKKSFIFLEDRDFIDKADFKSSKFIELNSRYVTFAKKFDNRFFEDLKSIDFQVFKDQSFYISDDYFSTYRIIEDVEGNGFGMLVVGEDINAQGNIVASSKSIANNTAMVALGLVVALLILMI